MPRCRRFSEPFQCLLPVLGGEDPVGFLPTLGIVVFTILPLVFMISMAFTSYDQNHTVLFSWVGLKNFGTVLGNSGGDVNAKLFFSVLAWTLIWAFFATFLNFFLGMFMAMIIVIDEAGNLTAVADGRGDDSVGVE